MRASKKYSDEEILKGIERGNEDVVEYIYTTCYRSVRHFVKKNSGSEEDAQDIFQETIVIFFRKVREEGFVLTSSLNTFLYSVGRLMWLKELEKKKRIIELDTSEDYISIDNNIIQLISLNDRLRLYRQKFEELSEDCKKVLRMSLEKISIKEITKRMKYNSEQHTKNRRFRCKKSLIKKIQESKEFKELSNEKIKNDRSIPLG